MIDRAKTIAIWCIWLLALVRIVNPVRAELYTQVVRNWYHFPDIVDVVCWGIITILVLFVLTVAFTFGWAFLMVCIGQPGEN